MKEVRRLCDVLRTVFDIGDWDFDLERKRSEGGADVTIDHQYRRIKIRIYDGFFREDARWQASTVVHEFAHMFNVPMYSLLDEARNGKMVTRIHADDILEQCNTRAEAVIVKLLTDNSLRKAFNVYIKGRGSKGPKVSRKPGRRPRKGHEVPENRDEEVHAERAHARRSGPR